MNSELKKNLIFPLLVISVLLNLLFLLYAYVQRAAAERARYEASDLEIKVHEQQERAKQNAQLAVQAQYLAEKARTECEAKLKTGK